MTIKKIKNKKNNGIAEQMLGKVVEVWEDTENKGMFKCREVNSSGKIPTLIQETWRCSSYAFEEE